VFEVDRFSLELIDPSTELSDPLGVVFVFDDHVVLEHSLVAASVGISFESLLRLIRHPLVRRHLEPEEP
jgi:hypothetical protein